MKWIKWLKFSAEELRINKSTLKLLKQSLVIYMSEKERAWLEERFK